MMENSRLVSLLIWLDSGGGEEIAQDCGQIQRSFCLPSAADQQVFVEQHCDATENQAACEYYRLSAWAHVPQKKS